MFLSYKTHFEINKNVNILRSFHSFKMLLVKDCTKPGEGCLIVTLFFMMDLGKVGQLKFSQHKCLLSYTHGLGLCLT